jgi:hypothetical protein
VCGDISNRLYHDPHSGILSRTEANPALTAPANISTMRFTSSCKVLK